MHEAAGLPEDRQAREGLRDAIVSALLDIPALSDGQARSMLVELVADALGRRPSLRVQPTAQLQFLELLRFCSRHENGMSAIATAVRALAGESPESGSVRRLVDEWNRRQDGPQPPRFGLDRIPPTNGPRPSAIRPSAPGPAAISPVPSAPRPVPPPGHTTRLPAAHDSGSHGPAAPSAEQRDFFISYTGVDRQWAEWIAWVLEESGYRVLVQAWDIVPGSNWYAAMEQAVMDCDRTIALLSPAYLRSAYGSQERQAAQRLDPAGLGRKLVPICIEPCEHAGLLGAVVSFDLYEMDATQAREVLLARIGELRRGRSKPQVPPEFPS